MVQVWHVQVSMKWAGRVYSGVINVAADQPAAIGRQGPRHPASTYLDTAAGTSYHTP